MLSLSVDWHFSNLVHGKSSAQGHTGVRKGRSEGTRSKIGSDLLQLAAHDICE